MVIQRDLKVILSLLHLDIGVGTQMEEAKELQPLQKTGLESLFVQDGSAQKHKGRPVSWPPEFRRAQTMHHPG